MHLLRGFPRVTVGWEGSRGMTDLAPWAELCERLAGTTQKLEKRAWMADYLRELPVEAAAQAALWLAGEIFPEADGRQLSVGGASLWGLVKDLSHASDEAVQLAYRRHGDLGSGTFDLLSAGGEPKPATLTIEQTAEIFAQLAAARGGAQSTARRQALLRDLLSRATPLEAKYLIKLMLGDMRIGVKAAQVEEAIAVATERPLGDVRRAVMLVGDLAEVMRRADADTLREAKMRLFHPLGFMLASPVATITEAVERFTEEIRQEGQAAPPDAGAATEEPEAPILKQAHVEDKYDGIRCQVHCGDPEQPGRVALFSRTREDMTQSFPEVVEAFATVTETMILDGEILAWDPDAPLEEGSETRGRALPFASLQNRIGRKRVTAAMREQTPVVFIAFDVLYLNDALVLEETLSERRARLEAVAARWTAATMVSNTPEAVPVVSAQGGLFAEPAEPAAQHDSGFARLVLASVAHLASAEQLEQAYADARARGNEGVMLKAAASAYQPGRRGLAWLKLKRELATLDVVVTGAEFGNGRRAGTLSDYTFAVADGETLKNVGKAYSGLTDEEIARLSAYFMEHTLEDYGHFRTVEPTIVLEVAFNNLMRSERHASGFAMRFPRILRIRDDKPVTEIDTLERVEEIYNAQPDRPVERN